LIKLLIEKSKSNEGDQYDILEIKKMLEPDRIVRLEHPEVL